MVQNLDSMMFRDDPMGPTGDGSPTPKVEVDQLKFKKLKDV